MKNPPRDDQMNSTWLAWLLTWQTISDMAVFSVVPKDRGEGCGLYPSTRPGGAGGRRLIFEMGGSSRPIILNH